MIEADDTLPKRNLGEGEPWGRVMEDTVKELVKGFKGQGLRVSNVSKASQSALDLGAQQGQQIVDTQDQVGETEQQVTIVKSSDSANVFDMTPITLRGASKFRAERWNPTTSAWETTVPTISEWFSDGFTIVGSAAGEIIRVVSTTFQTYFLGTQIGARYNITAVPAKTTPWSQGVEIAPLLRYEDGTEQPPGYGPWFISTAPGNFDSIRANSPIPSFSPSLSNTVSWAPAIYFTFSNPGDAYRIRGLQVFSRLGVAEVPEWATSANAEEGGQLFNDAPILQQNYNLFNTTVKNSFVDSGVSYTWVTNGIRLQFPSGSAFPAYLDFKSRIPVRPGSTLRFSADISQFNITPISLDGLAWSYSFQDVNGNTPGTSLVQRRYTNGAWVFQVVVPDYAVYMEQSLSARSPASGTSLIVAVSNPRISTVVTTNGLADGAVTQAKLDPSITFGVADNSLTTPKYQDLSVTNEKILSLDANKLSAYVPLANLDRYVVSTFGDLPTTGLTAGRSTAFTTSDGMEYTRGVGVWVPMNAPASISVPHAEFTASTSGFANNSVTLIGAFTYDSAASNGSTLATPVSSGIIRVNPTGTYSLAVYQATATAGVTSRSFVDIERLSGSTWIREGRWPIANGEDSVTSALNALRLTATNTQLRFTVYRNVASTAYAFTTRLKIERIGDI